MNQKNEYINMLEIPENTCNVTYKKPKRSLFRKRKKIDHEEVKESLLEKVNSTQTDEEIDQEDLSSIEQENLDINEQPIVLEEQEDIVEQTAIVSTKKKEKKRRFRLSVVGVQACVIGALVLTIFITNAVVADSGINVFMRSVFGSNTAQSVDDREFSEFTPVINSNDLSTIVLADGVMTFSGEGSVYPSVDGKVSSVVKGDDGLYTVEITHTSSFKSLISGLDYAYVGLEDSVYYNVPVGYSVEGGASLCFLDGEGSIISDYQLVDNSVVWAV